MKGSFRFVLVLAILVWGGVYAFAQAITGAATYTPEQLHELLVGQNEPVVIQTFGRLPNFIRGHDWFYENVAVYVPEEDEYYSLAVVCFSRADGRVWQVVCYPH